MNAFVLILVGYMQENYIDWFWNIY